jgi:hypothetical protein
VGTPTVAVKMPLVPSRRSSVNATFTNDPVFVTTARPPVISGGVMMLTEEGSES